VDFAVVLAPRFLVFFCTVGNSCERATNGNSFSLLGAFLHFFICFVSRFRVSCFFRSVTSKFESLPFLQVYRVSTIVLSWRWFLGQTGSFMREAKFFLEFLVIIILFFSKISVF